MNNTNTRVTIVKSNKSLLESTPVNNGAVYFIQDTKELFFDFESTRTEIKDILTLAADDERTSILFVPLNKFYFVLDTQVLWFYKDGTWYQVTSDLSNYYTKNEINDLLILKQDVIADLDTIRSGAALGSTAIQEETDPIYTVDKPNLALKSEIPVNVSQLNNDSGFITELPIATSSTLGAVKVDGTSILIQDDGTISAVQGPEGSTDYTVLSNKPQINSVELVGNKTLEELSIAKAVHTHAISDVLNLQTSLDSKQNVLTAGAGIKIEDNIISSVGGSNIIIRKW